MIKEAGIYQIKNLINGLVYIGSTINFYMRFSRHKSDFNHGKHKNVHMQRAFTKYGVEAFEFSILEVVTDLSKLSEREQYWIDITQCYDPFKGYNKRLKAEHNFGIKWSEQSKNNFSEQLKGKPKSRESILKRVAKMKGRVPTQASMAAKLANRDTEKWPHEKGAQCRCEECKAKRLFFIKAAKARSSISNFVLGSMGMGA